MLLVNAKIGWECVQSCFLEVPLLLSHPLPLRAGEHRGCSDIYSEKHKGRVIISGGGHFWELSNSGRLTAKLWILRFQRDNLYGQKSLAPGAEDKYLTCFGSSGGGNLVTCK